MNPRVRRREASRTQSTALRLTSARQPGSRCDSESLRNTRTAAASRAVPRISRNSLPFRSRRRSRGVRPRASRPDGPAWRRAARWRRSRLRTSPAAVADDEARRSASRTERIALRIRARGRTRFDEMQARRVVEVRVRSRSSAPRMSAVRRPLPAPASTRSKLDFRRTQRSGHLRDLVASSSPNSGPTSTLVKKSPARPER